jgi:hypothetical protein
MPERRKSCELLDARDTELLLHGVDVAVDSACTARHRLCRRLDSIALTDLGYDSMFRFSEVHAFDGICVAVGHELNAAFLHASYLAEVEKLIWMIFEPKGKAKVKTIPSLGYLLLNPFGKVFPLLWRVRHLSKRFSNELARSWESIREFWTSVKKTAICIKKGKYLQGDEFSAIGFRIPQHLWRLLGVCNYQVSTWLSKKWVGPNRGSHNLPRLNHRFRQDQVIYAINEPQENLSYLLANSVIQENEKNENIFKSEKKTKTQR